MAILTTLTAMPKLPVLLSRWYEFAKWLLERVDNFPKRQRFILGQRLGDAALEILALLVEAAYSPAAVKGKALADANRKLEVLRWIIRMARTSASSNSPTISFGAL